MSVFIRYQKKKLDIVIHVNVGIERFLKSCPKMYKTKKEKEV